MLWLGSEEVGGLKSEPKQVRRIADFTVPDNDRRLLIGKRLQDVHQFSDVHSNFQAAAQGGPCWEIT
jgi:hypothetical protein